MSGCFPILPETRKTENPTPTPPPPPYAQTLILFLLRVALLQDPMPAQEESVKDFVTRNLGEEAAASGMRF